jgi:hypothetical protein
VLYRLAADLLVLVHVVFVAYVVLGGLLVLRRPGTAWIHLPAALWGIAIEWTGGVCPLTPLENTLRAWGGQAGYPGGFVAHYLLPVLYPAQLTRGLQFSLGLGVLLANVGIYGWLLLRRRHRAAV